MQQLFGVTKSTRFGWYVLGSFIVISVSFIGQIPFSLAVLGAALQQDKPFPNSMQEMVGLLDLNWSLFLMLLTFVFAFVAFLGVIRFLHKQKLIEITTARLQFDWKRFFVAFGIWSIVTVSITLISFYDAASTLTWNFQPSRFAVLALIAIVMIPIQTSLEEYLFRGYLMQGFAQLHPHRWFPLFWTSFLFGVLHIANPEVQEMGYIVLLYYIGTGLFLGIITLMDNGMELALGFHAANNLMTALLVTTDSSALQTYALFRDTAKPSLSMELFLPLFIFYPLLVLLFAKIYRWSDWKLRLTGPISVPDIPQIKK